MQYDSHILTPPYTYFLFHVFLKTPATAKGDYPYEAVSSGSNSIINLIPETWPSSIREAPPIIPALQSQYFKVKKCHEDTAAQTFLRATIQISATLVHGNHSHRD